MVCEACEKKQSKVIVPDKWKAGARNTNGKNFFFSFFSLLRI